MSTEKTTIGEKVIQFLTDKPQGAPTEEILAALNIPKQALYTAAHGINKKNNGVRVMSVNSRYKLIIKKTSKNLPAIAEQQQLTPAKAAGLSVTNDLIRKMKMMSPTDREDTLDMLKKSHFYKKSAEALIEANEAINILRTSLTL